MRTLTDRDVQMFCIMENMKELSKCIDKQVVCLIVGTDGLIRSTGINRIIQCDKNCLDKEHRTCIVEHAESVAFRNLKDPTEEGLVAYVSLFPCAACQSIIDPIVDEIVTFGMAHKNWESDKISLFAHPVYSVNVYPDLQRDLNPTYAYDMMSINELDNFRTKVTAQDFEKEFYGVYIQRRADIYRHLLNRHTGRGITACNKTTYILKKP